MKKNLSLIPVINIIGAVLTYTYFVFILPPYAIPAGAPSNFNSFFFAAVTIIILSVFLGFIRKSLSPISGIANKNLDIKTLDLTDRGRLQGISLKVPLVGEMAFIAVSSIAIFLVLTYMLSRSISAPILRIKDAIKEVENNNLDVRVEIVSNDEIGEVAEGFNAMIKSLKETRELKDSFGKYVCKKIRDEKEIDCS